MAARIDSLARWAQDRGLALLGASMLLFVATSLLWLVRTTIPSNAVLDAVRTLFALAGLLAFLLAFVMLGLWASALAQQTWMQKLDLRLTGLEMRTKPTPEDDRLRALAANLDRIAPVLRQGRMALWAGAFAGAPSTLMFFPSTAVWLEPAELLGLALPIVVATMVASVLAVIRGVTILQTGRHLEAGTTPPPAERAHGRRRTSKAERTRMGTDQDASVG